MSDFTFLTEEQIFGDNQLDIFKIYGTKCAITDFSILLGGHVSIDYYTREGIGFWWTKSADVYTGNFVYVVDWNGDSDWGPVFHRYYGARPALPYSSISSISSNEARGKNGILEVEYGEYPQTIVSKKFARTLESLYSKGIINQTGKSYTTDSVSYMDCDTPFQARTHTEYEYNGKKYIRFISYSDRFGKVLSDGRRIQNRDVYWLEVEPIKWIIDERTNIALSKKVIFSGVQFDGKSDYIGNFNEIDIKEFMDKYFSKDIIPSVSRKITLEEIKNDNQLIVNDLGEENKILLKKINDLISGSSDNIKKIILDRVDLLINQYNEKMILEKPSLDFDNSSNLSLESNEIGDARFNLNLKLNDIVLYLASQNELLSLLKEIDDYKNILSKFVDKQVDKNESINDMLQNIAYFANQLDDKSKSFFLNKINNDLDEMKVIYEKELKMELDVTNGLIISDTLSSKQQLRLKFSNYLDDVKVEVNKMSSYVKLLNELKVEKNIAKYSEDNDILSFVNNTDFIISKLDNEKIKKHYDLEFDKLKTIYVKKIEKIIDSKSYSKENYVVFEKEFRQDLQNFVSEISRYSIKNANHKKLLLSINSSLQLLDGDKNTDFDMKKTVESSFVLDILDIIKVNKLTDLEKNKIYSKLKIVLLDSYNKLSSLTDEKEIDELENKLCGDLVGLILYLNEYISKSTKYNNIYGNINSNKKKCLR